MPSSTGVRLTMRFNFAQFLRATGWSESYDLGYPDLPTAVAAILNIQSFMRARVDCLGQGVRLVSAVLNAYTQPPAPGAPPVRRQTVALQLIEFPPGNDAYNKNFNQADPSGFEGEFASTVLYISLQTALTASPVYKRNVWIAGFPDVAIGVYTPQVLDPATLVAINKFVGALQNGLTIGAGKNNVSIRSVDRSGANSVKQCTAWNIGANTYTVPAHGFVVGQPVLAEGCRTAPGGVAPRGRYLIGTVVDANTIALAKSSPPTPPISTGGFRAQVFTFNTVAVATPLGWTKRNKGRPFGLLVGRQRRKLIARA